MARPKCPKTGKQRFPTQLDAQLTMATIQSNIKHRRKMKFREEPVRTYRCPHCGGFHLSSQSRNKNRRTPSN